MSAIITPSSDPAQAVMVAISQLSTEDKTVVAQFLHQEMETSEFPQWEMDIVTERLRMLDEGVIQALPLEEALASLDRKWARRF